MTYSSPTPKNVRWTDTAASALLALLPQKRRAVLNATKNLGALPGLTGRVQARNAAPQILIVQGSLEVHYLIDAAGVLIAHLQR